MDAIDIVIPHVDGAVPGYEALCRQHAREFVACHLRDLGELRYVLRSIARFAPWARVTLVVQTEAHLPSWLDRDTVRVVLHEAFIPATHLPTFHWATIVSHIHLIPGLAERYIVWEDDIVLTRRRDPESFFDGHGLPIFDSGMFPIIPGLEHVLGTYQRNMMNTLALMRRRLPGCRTAYIFPHVPMPIVRSLWAEHFDHFLADPVYADTVTRRSRGNEVENPTIDPNVVWANWIESGKRKRSDLHRLLRFLLDLSARLIPRARDPKRPGRALHAKFPVVNNRVRMARNMAAFARNSADFLNVNDEAYDRWNGPGSELTINPETVEILEQALAARFPDRSHFERTDG